MRGACDFRCGSRIGVIEVEYVFPRGLAGAGVAHARSGRDDQRTVGPLECGAQRLDRVPVLVAIRHEVREIMVEGGVDDGVCLRRSGAKAVRILQRAPVHLCAGRHQRSGAGVGSGQADHLMPGIEQFGQNMRADKACRTREKYAHGKLRLIRSSLSSQRSSRKSSDLIRV
jgi:hypothetical protein